MKHTLMERKRVWWLACLTILALLALSSLQTRADETPLADGNPPLTQRMVNQVGDFVGWMFETRLTNMQREHVRATLITLWQSRSQSDIDGTMQIVKAQEQVSALSPTDRNFARQKIADGMVKMLREKPGEPINRWLLDIYNSTHKPIAPGYPPLTRQMTDAYVETLFFMLAQASGKTDLKPTPDMLHTWAEKFAAKYKQMTPEQQQHFAETPMAWAGLQAAWARASEAERTKYRQQWAVSLRPVLDQYRAASQTATAPAQNANAASGSSGNGNVAEMMKKYQASQQMYSSMMRMSMEHHYSTINSINILAGNPYRYVNSRTGHVY